MWVIYFPALRASRMTFAVAVTWCQIKREALDVPSFWPPGGGVIRLKVALWLLQSQRCFHRSSPVCFTPASWFLTFFFILFCWWDKVNAWFNAVTPTQAPKVTFLLRRGRGSEEGAVFGAHGSPSGSDQPLHHNTSSSQPLLTFLVVVWRRNSWSLTSLNMKDKSWLNTHTAWHVRVILFTNDKKKQQRQQHQTIKNISCFHIYTFQCISEGAMKEKKKKKETSSHGWSGWIVFSG